MLVARWGYHFEDKVCSLAPLIQGSFRHAWLAVFNVENRHSYARVRLHILQLHGPMDIQRSIILRAASNVWGTDLPKEKKGDSACSRGITRCHSQHRQSLNVTALIAAHYFQSESNEKRGRGGGGSGLDGGCWLCLQSCTFSSTPYAKR